MRVTMVYPDGGTVTTEATIVDNEVIFESSSTPGSGGGQFVIVEELPEVGEPGTTYLVPNGGSSGNQYTEYVYVDGEYEIVGSAEIDLEDYYTKEEIVANPTLTGNEADLTSLQIGDTKYKVPSGGGGEGSGEPIKTFDVSIRLNYTETLSYAKITARFIDNEPQFIAGLNEAFSNFGNTVTLPTMSSLSDFINVVNTAYDFNPQAAFLLFMSVACSQTIPNFVEATFYKYDEMDGEETYSVIRTAELWGASIINTAGTILDLATLLQTDLANGFTVDQVDTEITSYTIGTGGGSGSGSGTGEFSAEYGVYKFTTTFANSHEPTPVLDMIQCFIDGESLLALLKLYAQQNSLPEPTEINVEEVENTINSLTVSSFSSIMELLSYSSIQTLYAPDALTIFRFGVPCRISYVDAGEDDSIVIRYFNGDNDVTVRCDEMSDLHTEVICLTSGTVSGGGSSTYEPITVEIGASDVDTTNGIEITNTAIKNKLIDIVKNKKINYVEIDTYSQETEYDYVKVTEKYNATGTYSEDLEMGGLTLYTINTLYDNGVISGQQAEYQKGLVLSIIFNNFGIMVGSSFATAVSYTFTANKKLVFRFYEADKTSGGSGSGTTTLPETHYIEVIGRFFNSSDEVIKFNIVNPDKFPSLVSDINDGITEMNSLTGLNIPLYTDINSLIEQSEYINSLDGSIYGQVKAAYYIKLFQTLTFLILSCTYWRGAAVYHCNIVANYDDEDPAQTECWFYYANIAGSLTVYSPVNDQEQSWNFTFHIDSLD